MALTNFTTWLRSCGFLPRSKPAQDRFLSEDDIVEHMMKRIGTGTREYASWQGVESYELIKGHHSTGRAIRNVYKLWDRRNPLTANEHPDEVSMRIMERVWCRVHGVKYNPKKREVIPLQDVGGLADNKDLLTFSDEPALRPPQMSVAEHRRLRNAALWNTIRGYVGR